MQFTIFTIDGSDYLASIGEVDLVESVDTAGTQRSYELTVHRAADAESPWLGGYSVRPEFVIRFSVGGQEGSGRWRRTRYDSKVAQFVSVGDIGFTDLGSA